MDEPKPDSLPASEPDPGVRPGDVLAGKYRVDRVLGAGGMGVVVAAHHLQLDEAVAIKFLLPDALKHRDALTRFEREARAAVKIKSEHVARVSDVGRLDSGAPYMVMEYLQGTDLSAWLEERGPMPVEQAAEFVLQACEAIAEAHALGIVHRDLKPSNLFCIRRADGLLSIKVLDFGISKVVAGTGGAVEMTQTNAVLGSPLYMSPEQIQSSKAVDTRSDLWSLGVILFELVSGQLPFTGEHMMDLAVKVATEPPLELTAARPGVPAGFARVVMRCLEKKREERFKDVGELAVALREFGPPRASGSVDRILRTVAARSSLHDESLPAAAPSSRDLPMAHAETVNAATPALKTQSSWGGASRGRGQERRWILWGAGGAAVAALLGAGALALKHPAEPPATAASAPIAAIAPGAPAATVSSSPSPSGSEATATPPVAPPSASPAASSPPAKTAAPRPGAPAVMPPSPPAIPAAPAPPPAAPAASKANCSPPYVIDALGHRQFKPECL